MIRFIKLLFFSRHVLKILTILIFIILLLCMAVKKSPTREVHHDKFSMTRKHIKGHDYIIVEGETGINIIHAVDCEMKDVGYNE